MRLRRHRDGPPLTTATTLNDPGKILRRTRLSGETFGNRGKRRADPPAFHLMTGKAFTATCEILARGCGCSRLSKVQTKHKTRPKRHYPKIHSYSTPAEYENPPRQ